MASIKMQYIVQSCPRCGKKLLKVPVNSTLIGSPLITCKGCGQTYKTDLREEWYEYEHKVMTFAVPAIIPVAMLVVGMFMGEPAIGLMAAIFGLIFALCWCLKDIIRIIMSLRRMRQQSYLDKLKEYGAITQREYEEFSQKAA